MNARIAVNLRRTRNGGPVRFAIIFLLQFAFLAQSYIAQTHIHIPVYASAADEQRGEAARGEIVQIGPFTLGHTSDHKAPVHQDSLSCPICHQIDWAKGIICPGNCAVGAPMSALRILAIEVDVVVTIGSLLHNWRSRAPPIMR